MLESNNMANKAAFVLVIATTYNRADLLPDAIESVLAQDYPYKKIVIIDDGSTDNTKEVCRKYIDAYPETVFYYYKENGGCASARNFGLNLIDDTIGYICFLDSDDKMLPGKLSRETELLESTACADFVYSDTVVFNENTRKQKISKAAAAGNPEELAIRHYVTNRITCGSVLYRVSVTKNRRFDDTLRYNEDSDFFQKLCLECSAVYSSLPGYWVRDHQNSKSKNMFEIQKAVLNTNYRIIELYPTFYRKHKKTINRRNRKIKRMYFVALMMERSYSEASNYIKNPLLRQVYYYVLAFLYALKPFIKKLFRR